MVLSPQHLIVLYLFVVFVVLVAHLEAAAVVPGFQL
jgi:hypothetical protein